MAAIKGQPAPKPQNLEGPIPQTGQQSNFGSWEDPENEAGGAGGTSFESWQDPMDTPSGQAPEGDGGPIDKPWYSLSQEGLGQATLDALPAAGAALGGFIAGGPTLGLATLGGVAAGAIAGQSLKATIETALGRGPESREQFYGDLARAGRDEAAYQVAGGVLTKAASGVAKVGKKALSEAASRVAKIPEKAMETYFHAPGPVKQMAEEFGGSVPDAANAIRNELSTAVFAKQAELEEPALKMIANKMPVSSSEAVAEAAKKELLNYANPLAGDLPEMAVSVRKNINDVVRATKSRFEDPVKQAFEPRLTSWNQEQVGNTVKELLADEISTKYKPFLDAYSSVDKIKAITPVDDASRRSFVHSLTNWGNESFQHNPKKLAEIKRYKEMFEAAQNGASFDDVIGSIQDDINREYSSNLGKASNMADFYSELKDRANTYMKGRIEAIALRAQNGRATTQELNVIKQIMTERGIMEPDPNKYAKVLARDYLTGQKQLAANYGDFSRYLEDVGTSTKVRKRAGANTLIEDISNLPSEKLVERMLDPKNAASFRRLKENSPAIFDQLANFKISQVATKSLGADGNIDYVKLHKNFNNPNMLPPAFRGLLMKPEDMKALNQLVTNKTYNRINEITAKSSSMLDDLSDPSALIKAGQPGTAEARNLRELSILTGKNLVPDVQHLAAVKTATDNLNRLKDLEPSEVLKKLYSESSKKDFYTLTSGFKGVENTNISQALRGYKVREIAEMSTTDGVLDLTAFRKNLDKQPQHVKDFLFPGEELKIFDQTLANPQYKRLNALTNASSGMLKDLSDPAPLIRSGIMGTNEYRNLAELGRLTGVDITPRTQTLAAMQEFGTKDMPLTKQAAKLGIDVLRPVSNAMGEVSNAVPSPLKPVIQREAIGRPVVETGNFLFNVFGDESQ